MQCSERFKIQGRKNISCAYRDAKCVWLRASFQKVGIHYFAENRPNQKWNSKNIYSYATFWLDALWAPIYLVPFQVGSCVICGVMGGVVCEGLLKEMSHISHISLMTFQIIRSGQFQHLWMAIRPPLRTPHRTPPRTPIKSALAISTGMELFSS